MKRRNRSGLNRLGWIVLFLLTVGSLHAERFDVSHYYAITASGGYSQFMTNYGGVTTRGQEAFSVGLGYELRYRSLWFQTGLETRYMANRSQYANALDIYAYNVLDTQGKPFTMHYIVSDYSEKERIMALQVPLLVGFISKGGFYLGGGLRLGGAVFSNVQADLKYRTEGIYSQFGLTLSDMKNHYFTDYEVSVTGKARAGFVGSALVEMGGDIMRLNYDQRSGNSHVLKLAAYGELGFNSPFLQTEKGDVLEPEPGNAQLLRPQSVYNVQMSGDYFFLPFSVGVKMTYLFRLAADKCVRCKR